MVVVIDNYDSFTYNLVQYLGMLDAAPCIVRNDEIGVEQLAQQHPTGILISPGPGKPGEAGLSVDALSYFGGKIPVFGVCLGHQVIAEHYGATVIRAERIMHGRTSEIHHQGHGVLVGLPSPFIATRYHSLIVDRTSIPDSLEVSATTATGEVMGLRHRKYDVEGVQFHPESFLSEHGHQMLQNWLKRVRGGRKR